MKFLGYGLSIWDTYEEAEASFKQPRTYDGIRRTKLPVLEGEILS